MSVSRKSRTREIRFGHGTEFSWRSENSKYSRANHDASAKWLRLQPITAYPEQALWVICSKVESEMLLFVDANKDSR